MDYYATQHLATIFGVSTTAVKNWAIEFSSYLSETAKPPDGRKRRFQESDCKVLALVNEYRLNGYTWEDAHVALRSGQRGEMPVKRADIAPVETPQAITNKFKEEIMNLRQELEEAKQIAKQADVRAEQMAGQNLLLREMMAEKERRIDELVKQVARLEVGQTNQ